MNKSIPLNVLYLLQFAMIYAPLCQSISQYHEYFMKRQLDSSLMIHRHAPSLLYTLSCQTASLLQRFSLLFLLRHF